MMVLAGMLCATLCKSINRATGTFLASSLGIGVHWIATQSGAKFEPVIAGVFIFILGVYTFDNLSVSFSFLFFSFFSDFAVLKMTIRPFFTASIATFSRFIPSFKARFDYGAMIFVLTFSLVSVSGYRVDRLFAMAHHRVATIVSGTTICILTSMIFCPVWAGNELHFLINRNMEKLADSLDGMHIKSQSYVH
ncbi:Aluminum-activated malate transporter 10 [Camellia lanceoleosa]|uniref:Aluminum-activated malate transporter 10 n=1 Tax=Camellia lanceoleosa TaxID=1840588 RepID=A0ACC0IIC3_9ERIC|nr:Aluminum-activated malate transporter 10 [Camellia lanceoleosa]